MSVEHLSQPAAATSKQVLGSRDGARSAGERAVWLSAQEAADYLRSPSVRALYMWAKRHGVIARHRGSRLLFARQDLDRAIGVVARKRA